MIWRCALLIGVRPSGASTRPRTAASTGEPSGFLPSSGIDGHCPEVSLSNECSHLLGLNAERPVRPSTPDERVSGSVLGSPLDMSSLGGPNGDVVGRGFRQSGSNRPA